MKNLKKLLSFVCCMLPMGGWAATVVGPDNANPGVINTDTNQAWQDAIAAGDTITIANDSVNAIISNAGFSIAGNMYAGVPNDQGSISGSLYVLDSVKNPFVVQSQGDISIHSILQVLNGKTLEFKTSDSNPAAFDLTVGSGAVNEGILIGDADSTAILTLSGIDALTVNGAINAYGNFTANANSVNTGSVMVNAGNTIMDATGDMVVGGLIAGANSGDVDLSAGGDLTSNGIIQNLGTGNMELDAGGDIEITGALENKSTGDMTVTAGDLVVSEAVTNESNSATMTLNVDNWSVNGGSASSYSFVNNGDFYATVKGETYLEYGLSLNGMQTTNEFSLDTGTLVFGNNANTQTWFNAFSNVLNSFNLAVRDGNVSVGTILNGEQASGDSGTVVTNANASMRILAQNISATTVRNQGGTLTLLAADLESGYDTNVAPAVNASVGDITITGQVIGVAGTTTDIIASDNLEVQGAVSNTNASMTLNGNKVSVADVSNVGVDADMDITSLTEASGLVEIDGNVTNTLGNTTIWAKDVSVGGTITNNSGSMTVRGSDTGGGPVQIGAISAAGGVFDLEALAGQVNVAGDVMVAGGALNLGGGVRNMAVEGDVQVAGDFTASATNAAAGGINVAASGTVPFNLSADSILISGDLSLVDDVVVRNVRLHAPVIGISGDVAVENLGVLTLGTVATDYVDVAGDLTVNNGGTFETYANEMTVGALSGDSLFKINGTKITADTGNVAVDGNLYFDPDNDVANPASGMVVRNVTSFSLVTTAADADISVGAVSVGAGNTLSLDSADMLTVGGVIANNGTMNINAVADASVTGKITNSATGVLDIDVANLNISDLENAGAVDIVATDEKAVFANVTNTGGTLDIQADTIGASAIANTGGVMSLSADSLSAQSLVVSGNTGSKVYLDVADVTVTGNVNVAADLVQGGDTGMLNLNATDVTMANLIVGGNLVATSGNTTYDISTNANITGNIDVADGATTTINAGNSILAADVINAGSLNLTAGFGVDLGMIVNNSGVLSIDSGADYLTASALNLNAGNLVLDGVGATINGAIATDAMLYQNYGGGLSAKDINIVADDYVLTTTGLNVSGINQSGKLVVNTSDIDVGGDIVASDLRFVTNGNWQNVNVDGSVSGNVDFIGLGKMDIADNYTFNDGSSINAGIQTADVVGRNYWATVSLNDDETLGQITNADDGNAGALIMVGGKFESNLNTLGSLSADGGALADAQIGIDIFDIVDQGTAIWFLHADEGVSDLATKIRNLNVSFCNADGSVCYNYLDSLDANNGSDEDLPAYISVRDVNEDGSADSLYIVFDPRFGGPVEVFKIQPIVEREDVHTDGEYVSAGALDDMIAGQLKNKKFYNRTPIEVIPIIFEGTNLSTMANELYDRMENYVLDRDGAPLARFSRLFQVREVEQIAGSIALNEHTSFRSFEDRMFDEFIWNRNRNLNKAWLDVDYGMFYQNIDDGKHTDGHRFSVAGGFDWQESNTLMLGLTGRVSRTESDTGDSMDLSYTGKTEFGAVDISVADTNVGLGGYLMKTLGEGVRLYGNAFLDMHFLDVDRVQNFVGRIDGDGTAFSLISEWGLMHDILNQYVVGNLYARVGYNFGFNVKEKVGGDDYMRLESDGYMVLTPGYSLIAQKRIYPSAWFQIRPYASIGVEYDVLGAPDFAEYKFVVADNFTKYDIDIDPLWANIGGGVELLSANGVQVGVDYRYQYNDAIQLHNIRVSGSYRF